MNILVTKIVRLKKESSGRHALLITYLSLLLLQGFAQTKDSADDGRLIRIPVVVHVMFNKTTAISENDQSNGTDDINDSLILVELQDLNLDFSKKNEMSVLDRDFETLVGNPKMEFYLADTPLQSKGQRGIQRVYDNGSVDRPSLLIHPETCMNIFIGSVGNNSNILGDRINISYFDVGHHTHVFTHETGHWLGLYHVWGKIGSCSALGALFGDHDDEIDDTPPQYKCTDLTYSTICPPRRLRYYKGYKPMYNNFMDYSGCRCMFTVKQVIRIRNNIINNKNKLFIASK